LDTVFRAVSDYWTANRSSEAVANGTTVIDLAETMVQSGAASKTEYTFSFNKDLYTQHFVDLTDSVARVKALLIDAAGLDGSIRIDTLPYLRVTYLDENDSTVTEKLYAKQASIWNSYTYLGTDINSDFSIRSGDREALVFEFNRDEIVNFLDTVIPFGANLSFQVNALSAKLPSVELRYITGYENTVLDYYNDGLDYGPTFTAGIYSMERAGLEERLRNESDESGTLVSSMLNNWSGTNKLYGKVILEPTTTMKRPAIMKFPKVTANDTLYRLNIYYIEKDIKQ
ncbi:MAG: hypothetical protein KDD94_04695, partial [Calditrichaeota bacterium]|nr:hypothetical protein [Calditrichota bacterium]